MRITTIFILTLIISFYLISPSFALSENAEKFIMYHSQTGQKFPPPGWSITELREASLEVLDAIENNSIDSWFVTDCLMTLGYTQFPEDLPRIMKYKDDMKKTVLRSLRGFAHPDAINHLIKHVDSDSQIIRESAIKSLAEVDFSKMDKPEKWKGEVLAVIKKALEKEDVAWLIRDIKKALKKIETPPIE